MVGAVVGSFRLGPGPVTESWLLPIGPNLGPRCGPAKLVTFGLNTWALGPTQNDIKNKIG